MIVDLAKDAAPELPEYDVCVVGSGPAGATLARELAGGPLRVCVLESGVRVPTQKGDALRSCESAGIRVKEWSRERVLGGASTTWAGLSSPLDPIDLAPRPWAGAPGWPIPRAELLALYEEAAARYRFPAARDFGPEGFARLRARGASQIAWKSLEEKVFLAAAEPQDFGRECADAWAAANVDLLLDATVVELVAAGAPGAARATAARVRTAHGELWVRARAFVLAAGGIENARLLLVSRGACPAGLGNETGRVGLGFMNHPKNYFGILRLARPIEELPYFFGALHGGFAGYAGLRLSEARQRELGVLNSYARFEPLFPWSDDAGVEALVTLVKRSQGLYSRWKRGRADEVVELRDWSETGDDSERQNARAGKLTTLRLAGSVVLHAPSVVRYAWFRLGRRRPAVRRVRLRHFLEMRPDDSNRIELAERGDAHGVPLPRVRHACGELDRRSLVELWRALRTELAANGLGELEGDLEHADPWPIDQDASHHMGATRMSADPRLGVVDPQLRLHGARNVWIAGASVFPTSGCANPTLTIVALSIRLARRLSQALSGAEVAR
ncbi:MAG: GMC family oxidoreductase [Planctomycetes bacterium]|nr:GMC family oxidoreductase [Planctomycetota bacterium]